MSRIGDAGWRGGIFRNRQGPAGSLYDAENVVVDDRGNIVVRGGVQWAASDVAGTLPIEGVTDAQLVGGQRTMFWTAEDTSHIWPAGTGPRFFALDVGSSIPVQLLERDPDGGGASMPQATPRPRVRMAGLGGVALFAADGVVETTMPARTEVVAYAGSLKTAPVAATLSFTAGSVMATGAGFGALDAGMFFIGGGNVYVVRRVIDAGNLELLEPSPLTAAAVPGTMYPVLTSVWQPSGAVVPPGAFLATVGGRAVLGQGTRLWMSETGNIVSPAAVEEVELYTSASIVGLDAVGDSVIAFTTDGIWEMTNASLNLLDVDGNVQRRVQRINESIVLWGDAGIARWSGGLVVPGVDDVYLFSPGQAPVPISDGIRDLYRGYVRGGMLPGVATVFNGHYVLPVVTRSGTPVDTLVCRLDLRTLDLRAVVREAPSWVRWSGQARSRAFGSRATTSRVEPRLLGATAARLTNLTACVIPDGTISDVDGTEVQGIVTTREYDTGPRNRNTVRAARLEVLPLGVSWSLQGEYERDGQGWVVMAVETIAAGVPQRVYRLAKRARRVRFRFTARGPRAELRSLAVDVRDSSRP